MKRTIEKQLLFNYHRWKELLIMTGLSVFLLTCSVISASASNLFSKKGIVDISFITIKGQITDASTNEFIFGASIMVEGTKIVTMSNDKGDFTIEVPNINSVLLISYIGYISLRIELKGQSILKVMLSRDVKNLDEVVVVAYGTQKKASVTGAISSIGTKDLLQSPQANISNALVGRMPGLLAVQRSGIPGEDQSTLRIRGIATFSGSADPLVMVDGIENSNYNNIDPNEIESIAILKDASATAVYGVRGANGVLLITTKRGKSGKPTVSLSSNFGIARFTNLRKNMNSYDWARNYNEGQRYDSYITGNTTLRFTEEEIAKYKSGEDPIFYPSTDWVDYTLKPYALQAQHNMNISGGTDRIKYFMSVGYLTQESMFKVFNISDYNTKIQNDRYNFRSNFDFEITKRLSAKVDLSYQAEERGGQGSSAGWVMGFLYEANPAFSPGIIDNKIVNVFNPLNSYPLLYLMNWGYETSKKNNLNSSIRFNYELDFITKGLSFHTSISNQSFTRQYQRYYKELPTYRPKRLEDNSIVYIPNSAENPYSFGENISKSRKNYSEFGFDYSREFGNHKISGLLLYNQSKLYDPSLEFLIPNGYQGVVGRLTYNYKDRYLAEYNFGYNGTENFAQGRRFGYFPAYSLGWVLSKESFFPKNNIITYAKIRGSYGEVGNDKIGGSRFLYLPGVWEYITSPTYYYGGIYMDGRMYNFGTIGTSLQSYTVSEEGKWGNPLLTWERAKKTNIGFEMQAWKSKIRITVDYFEENRDNILAARGTIPDILGATHTDNPSTYDIVLFTNIPSYNLGKMKNSGYEGEISYNESLDNGLSYWMKANYTFAHNVVVFQDEVHRPFSYQYTTGQRYGQFYGLIADGFYNTWEEVNDPNRPVSQWQNNALQPGDVKYRDVNGDGKITVDDMVPIGYSDFPENVFGFSFGAYFKGFDISVMFQGASNVSLMTVPEMRRGYYQEGGAPDYLLTRSWTQERYEQGGKIDFPRPTAAWDEHNYQPSTLWLKDASYLRLKNLEIGYSLSKKAVNRIGLSSVRFYVNGSNLLTWSKNLLPGQYPDNPASNMIEEQNNYPATMVTNFGVNIKF